VTAAMQVVPLYCLLGRPAILSLLWPMLQPVGLPAAWVSDAVITSMISLSSLHCCDALARYPSPRHTVITVCCLPACEQVPGPLRRMPKERCTQGAQLQHRYGALCWSWMRERLQLRQADK
jgi:hypothetical protein